MKIFCYIFTLLLVFANSLFAITWEPVETPLGKVVYLDTDSITQYQKYYFYNIKAFNEYINDYSVITIQSSKNTPFSARIKTYSVKEYEDLSGNYKNISEGMTTKLEPVTFESQVNCCYKKVKQILSKNSVKISF